MKEQTLEEKLKALSLDELNKWTMRRIAQNDPVTKAKLSQANKGRKPTDEERAKISEANKRRKHTSETKAKMSEAAKGKKHTSEARAKMSKAKKGRKKEKRKLTEVQELEIKRKYATGKYTHRMLAEEYGVSTTTVWLAIKKG